MTTTTVTTTTTYTNSTPSPATPSPPQEDNLLALWIILGVLFFVLTVVAVWWVLKKVLMDPDQRRGADFEPRRRVVPVIEAPYSVGSPVPSLASSRSLGRPQPHYYPQQRRNDPYGYDEEEDYEGGGDQGYYSGGSRSVEPYASSATRAAVIGSPESSGRGFSQAASNKGSFTRAGSYNRAPPTANLGGQLSPPVTQPYPIPRQVSYATTSVSPLHRGLSSSSPTVPGSGNHMLRGGSTTGGLNRPASYHGNGGSQRISMEEHYGSPNYPR